jgi:predicted DNA-binding antitoxin AbrB/MazE fold protein
MSKVVTVVFDGQFLRPNAPLDLEPGKRYVITIETEFATVTIGDAWEVLEAFAGTVEAPPDWSIEHKREGRSICG